MFPVLFELPVIDFPLRSFGVLVAVGFLTAIWSWTRVLARHGQDPGDPERGSQVAMWILIGVVGGARLMYVGVEVSRYVSADVTPVMRAYLEADDSSAAAAALRSEEPENYEVARRISVGHGFVADPVSILFIWQGGLVMFGGFFGAIVLGMMAARKRGLDPWNALDTGLPCGFIGQFIGRWGCLAVGDDYGSVVPEGSEGLPFPLTITVPSLQWLESNPESLFDHALAGKTLWATQVWMSLNAALVAIVGLWMLKRRRWVGQAAAVVLVHYSITRFLIEAFRGDEVRGVWFGGTISTSQLIAIPGFLFGIWWLWKNRGRRDEIPRLDPAT